MSGGVFEYNQYKLLEIADQIEHEILISGKKKTDEELSREHWKDDDWYDKYPADKYHYKYKDEVITEFQNAVIHLRNAYVYAKRIDWLLSGDDGEETFLSRLKEDLHEIQNKI